MLGEALGDYLGRLGAKLGVRLSGDAVSAIDFLPVNAPDVPPASALASRVAEQLERYFQHPAWAFDLPLEPEGTPFQRRVWDALRTIPAGETRGYGELARALNTGARAVGSACRANPLPIIVPCHRVVAAQGLGGYTGDTHGQGLALKHWLLAHERRG